MNRNCPNCGESLVDGIGVKALENSYQLGYKQALLDAADIAEDYWKVEIDAAEFIANKLREMADD